MGVVLVFVALEYRYVTDWRHNVIISLQRTGCFGACPTYELTIYEDGTVIYNGHEFVNVVGKRRANIGEAKVRKLADDLERSNYFSFADNYDDEYVSDFPSAVTFVRIGSHQKRI